MMAARSSSRTSTPIRVTTTGSTCSTSAIQFLVVSSCLSTTPAGRRVSASPLSPVTELIRATNCCSSSRPRTTSCRCFRILVSLVLPVFPTRGSRSLSKTRSSGPIGISTTRYSGPRPSVTVFPNPLRWRWSVSGWSVSGWHAGAGMRIAEPSATPVQTPLRRGFSIAVANSPPLPRGPGARLTNFALSSGVDRSRV